MTHVSDNPSSEPPAGKGRLKMISLALAGIVAGLIFGLITIRFVSGDLRFGSPSFHGIVIQSAGPVDDFSLTAHPEGPVRLQDFRGKVVLLYFGYTYCPDVCPATLSELSKTMAALKTEERDQVQVIMVTVDPERDTAEILDLYLDHFDPSFLGLSGSEDEIAAAAAPFGIYYQKQEGSVERGYLVDHTATVVAVDQDGVLRLTYHFNTPGEDIAADVRRLIRE